MPRISRFPYSYFLSHPLLTIVNKDYISVSGIPQKGLGVCIKYSELVDYIFNVTWRK